MFKILRQKNWPSKYIVESSKMVPQIIEDYVTKVTDRSAHKERRQFYADTLRDIVKAANAALVSFEKETKTK